jgi:hypothetical protein
LERADAGAPFPSEVDIGSGVVFSCVMSLPRRVW